MSAAVSNALHQNMPVLGGRGAPLFDTRRGKPADANFIYATWLRCYKHSSRFARNIPDRIFFEQHHAVVARLLDRCEVLIATPANDAETILGYSVTEPGTIHFVYVKKPFRRMGIAGALLAHLDPESCLHTHWTEGWDLLRSKWPNCEYNPYLI